MDRLYNLKEILKYIPMSRAGLYAAAAKGKIPTVTIGRRIFVPAWYINKILLPPQEHIEAK